MNVIKFLLMLAFTFNVNAASVRDTIIDSEDASGESVQILQKDFEELKTIGAIPSKAKLFVKKMKTIAVTMGEKFIVVSENLASMDKDARLLVLAHEGSHARHKDDDTMIANEFMGTAKLKMVMLSHNNEMRADKEAVDFVKLLNIDGKAAAIKVLGNSGESETHPASVARIAAM